MIVDAPLTDQLLRVARAAGIRRIVVGAVIREGDAILFLERQPGDFLGGILELPSGEVDHGESLADALEREVQEETGLAVQGEALYLGHFDYQSRSGTPTRQLTFAVDVHRPYTIRLSEHADYRWLRVEEAARAGITPETLALLKAANESRAVGDHGSRHP